MNKLKFFPCIIILVVIVIAFPFSSETVISGNGEVQTFENEKLDDCILSVKITEIRSLCFSYKKQFCYTLNGKEYNTFETTSYSEADDLCMISQMYYNETINAMSLCSLVFPKDLSYALIRTDTQQYYIENTP